MSLSSAREKLKVIDDPSGYCFPLSLDACMKQATLPENYYELFKQGHEGQALEFNECVSKLLKDFFKIDPQPDTETAPVACFSAYGASPQLYMPDVNYDFSAQLESWKGTGVRDKHLRIRELVRVACENRCMVLFDSHGAEGGHVAGLELIDTSEDGSGYTSKFIIRDNTFTVSNRLYDSNALSGIDAALGFDEGDDYSPLPEFSLPWYPEGSTSPNLIILPPEPKS